MMERGASFFEEQDFGPGNGDGGDARVITATPYVWRDPTTIPPRDFVYGNHYVRRYVSCTISMGGVGKSIEAQTEVAAMITGRDLLGIKPKRALRVWYINLEDPRDEIDRRFAAIFKHYKITPIDIGNRLFVDSGRERNFIIARETRNGLVFDTEVIADISRTISENKIDVVYVDPLGYSIEIDENNNKMGQVVRQWRDIAEDNNCSVELEHHVRKGSSREGYTIEDARGAVALINGCRSARVFNTMTRDEGERAGVEKHRSYFRIDNGKSNLAPPPDESEWRRYVSVDLENATEDCESDRVGVPVRWTWPDPLDKLSTHDLLAAQKAVSAGGPWRRDAQAKAWVGNPIAQALHLDPTDKAHKTKIKGALKIWISTGAFRVVETIDDHREPKEFVEVGKWADGGQTTVSMKPQRAPASNAGTKQQPPISAAEMDELRRRGFSLDDLQYMNPKRAREVIADTTRNKLTERYGKGGDAPPDTVCRRCKKPGARFFCDPDPTAGMREDAFSRMYALHLECVEEFFASGNLSLEPEPLDEHSAPSGGT